MNTGNANLIVIRVELGRCRKRARTLHVSGDQNRYVSCRYRTNRELISFLALKNF